MYVQLQLASAFMFRGRTGKEAALLIIHISKSLKYTDKVKKNDLVHVQRTKVIVKVMPIKQTSQDASN